MKMKYDSHLVKSIRIHVEHVILNPLRDQINGQIIVELMWRFYMYTEDSQLARLRNQIVIQMRDKLLNEY